MGDEAGVATKPFIIGVAGGSGSGKTTVVREIVRELGPDQVTVIIHCGSRGFGYQVCEDYLGVMDRAVKKYGIDCRRFRN